MNLLRHTLRIAWFGGFSFLAIAPAVAAQWGALAYNSSNGNYGFSYNYYSQGEAVQRALGECGYGCQVVLRFSNGCAAYATGYNGAYGWGHYVTRYDAERRALGECGARGGGCQIRVWACNGG